MIAAPAEAVDACDVQFAATVSSTGFTHPGVGLTAPILENAKAQIAAGAQPWSTYYEAMRTSPAAALGATSSNASASDSTKVDSDAFNSQSFNSRFIADGLKAYTQALMYVFTGEQVYRSNAMSIIRIWEQMDPAKFAVFPDSHIHTGIPLQRMVTAAELLRYGSCASDAHPWTTADTEKFTANLVRPVIETFQHDQNHFMNQHTYPLMGAMAGYIFMDDKQRYDEAVEWFTVNASANDQGFNGSVKRLFRLVERDDATGEPLAQPRVQHIEMGRDQAHGGGDITNAYLLARMMMAQGTKVDPVAGTPSAASNAVGPYEFLDDRILATADYFWRFMLGYDTEWTPVGYAISADGTIRDTYDHISNQYRGRYNTASFWDLYYYYTFERGIDLDEKAPYFAEAFSKRLPPDYYYRGALTRAWDNVDAGGEFWLYAPADAAGTSVPSAQTSATTLQVEDRFTSLSGRAEARADAGTGYVRLSTDGSGSKIAFLNGSSTQKRFALRFRADAQAQLHLSFGLDKTIDVPGTDGQWRTLVVDLGAAESLNDLLYIEARGEGANVDIDSLLVGDAVPVPLAFDRSETKVVAFPGATATANLAVSAPRAGLTYSASGLPSSATLDPNTGELTWAPPAASRSATLLAVSDGTVIATHRLELAAAQDASGALATAAEGFDADVAYESPSRAAYDKAFNAASEALNGATPTYVDALEDLVSAVAHLAPLSPQTSDAGLRYPDLLATSTAGNSTPLLIDGDNQSGTTYGQAVGLGHVLNFGPFHRVSASAFELQSNIFEDRLANSAVFGSNDGTTWTRLTPNVTTMTQDLQRLDVAPELRDDRFQYIKVQLLKPLPDVLYGNVQNLFEITELHILGERHEMVGSIDEVTIASPGSLKGRVVPGDTVTLNFHATAPISDVRVSIAGANATVRNDGASWTATAALPDTAPNGGPVPFTIDHTLADGTVADTILGTSDGSGLYASVNTGIVDNTLKSARVLGADGLPSATLAADAAKLFDGSITTHTDTRLVNGRASLEWDLGEGGSMSIGAVDVLVRQDQYGTSRLSTLRFEGSADRETWVPLTTAVQASPDWQRLSPVSSDAFRYVRLTNGNIINVAETRVLGTYTAPVSDITALRVTSSNPLKNYAVDGDKVTLDVTLSTPPREISATIDGQPVQLESAGSPTTFRATVSPAVGERRGQTLGFAVDHVTAAGRRAVTARSTTDGSSVRLGTNDGLITNLMAVAKAVKLDGTSDTSTVARPKDLFDSNLATSTDARVANGSADIVLDLGTDHRVTVQRMELALRQDNLGLTRMRNLRVLASNDLAQWTTLAQGVQSTLAWQEFGVSDTTAAATRFRYLRLTNGDILNVAELRLYGAVESTIVSIDEVDVTTFRNEAPALPATVAVTRADGTTQDLAVAWAAMPGSTWAQAGRVDVPGTITGSGATTVAHVTVVDDGSTAAPAKGVLSTDNGRDTGLHDGDFNVVYNMWWGQNARRVLLLEDGVLVAERALTMASPLAQAVSFPISGKPNGTYQYTARLVNSSGTVDTVPLSVVVKDANPAAPVLSNDNWDGDGSFVVTANLWWGTNATSYAFFENGQQVATGDLTAATPGAQHATFTATGRPPGQYVYTVVFTNAAGSTQSAPHSVAVKR